MAIQNAGKAYVLRLFRGLNRINLDYKKCQINIRNLAQNNYYFLPFVSNNDSGLIDLFNFHSKQFKIIKKRFTLFLT